jgi:hypothetical protein
MKPPFGHSTAAPTKGNPFAALRKGGKTKKHAKGKLAPPMPMMPPAAAPVAPVLPTVGKRVSVAPALKAEPDMDQMGGPSDKDADDK